MFLKQKRLITISIKRIISQKNITPHSIAMGFALGIFIGLGPTFGFQIIPVLLICTYFKYHKLTALLAVWITNPLTVIPIYTFNFSVGKFIFSGKNNVEFGKLKYFFLQPSWKEFFLIGQHTIFVFVIGSLIVGLMVAFLSYFIVKKSVIIIRKKKFAKFKNRFKNMKNVSKMSVRKIIVQQRLALSKKKVQLNSNSIIAHLENLLEKEKFKFDSVMSFYPIKNEIDTLNWINMNLSLGKKVFLPKVISSTTMEANAITDLKKVENGYQNIPEPVGKNFHRGDIDLILIPGLAFNLNLHRIGYGKGFYDKFLINHSESLKIGLFYDFQKIINFKVNDNDVPLDYVITPNKIYLKNYN